ncbi:hypothetical protein TNCV_2593131 [Trichonephila clavipes]|nr:hypothetical protein TNCV_2593131 [Trichonephila clavipes]
MQEKITQLVSRNETTQLNRRKQLNSAAGTNNSTQQQERNAQLVSRNETTQLNRRKQLNSSVGTKQLNSALPSTAYNRHATACNRLHRLPQFTAESAFLPTHDNIAPGLSQ